MGYSHKNMGYFNRIWGIQYINMGYSKKHAISYFLEYPTFYKNRIWGILYRIWGIQNTEYGIFLNTFYRIWGIRNDVRDAVPEYGVF